MSRRPTAHSPTCDCVGGTMSGHELDCAIWEGALNDEHGCDPAQGFPLGQSGLVACYCGKRWKLNDSERGIWGQWGTIEMDDLRSMSERDRDRFVSLQRCDRAKRTKEDRALLNDAPPLPSSLTDADLIALLREKHEEVKGFFTSGFLRSKGVEGPYRSVLSVAADRLEELTTARESKPMTFDSPLTHRPRGCA